MRAILLTTVVALTVALLSTVLIEAQPVAEEDSSVRLTSVQHDEPQDKDSASKEDNSEEKNQGKTKREAAVYLSQGGPYSPNGLRIFSRKEYRTLPSGNVVVEKSYYFANGTKVEPGQLQGQVIVDSSSQQSSSEEIVRILGKREASPQGMMKQAAGPGMYGYPGNFGGGGGIFRDSSSQGVSSSEERRMYARGKRGTKELIEELTEQEEPEALVRLERSPKKKGHGSSSSLYSQLYGY